MTGQSPLDARVAELLLARGIVAREHLEALRARAAGRAPGRSGSALLEVVVELGVLTPAAATALLAAARGQAPRGLDGSGGRPALDASSSAATKPVVRAAPPRPGPPPAAPGIPGHLGDTRWGTLAGSTDEPPPPTPAPSDRTVWPAGPAPAPRPAAQSDRTMWPGGPPGPPAESGAPPGRVLDTPPPADATRWEGPGAPPRAGPQLVVRDPEEGGTRWDSPVQDDRTIASPDSPAPGSGTFHDRLELPGAVPVENEPPEARYQVLSTGPAPEDGDRRRVLDRRLQRELVLVVARRGQERALTRHARILAQLDHPSIPSLHDVLRWNGAPAFVTDAVEGLLFGDAARGDEALPEATLLRAFLDVAGAVAHAHERGLVHGSLGPAAVVVGTYGRAWVTGWETAQAHGAALPGVARAAADADAAPRPADVPRAPEVMEGNRPEPTSDVWGLGRVLERLVTAAGRGAAPELRAIARKACARSPGARYESASDLADDVSRYLDGRSVGALKENPVRALRRLAKHHPAAAGVVSVALLVALGSGAATLAVTRRQLGQASAQAAVAAAQRDAAGRLLREANAAHAATQARQQVAEQRLALERTLRAPTQGHGDPDAARAEQLDRAAGQLAALERAAAGVEHDATFVAARLRRARAEHHLRGAARPDPARALADYRALAEALARRLEDAPPAGVEPAAGGPFDERVLARAQLADAQLGRFLAARRLPGAEHRREEEAALSAMAELPGTRELARVERAVRAVEAEAARLVELQPPQTPPEDPALVQAVDRLVEARPDHAYAHELRGRLRVALSFPGLHRSQPVRLPDGSQHEAEVRSLYYGAFDAFFRASYLDPTETEPRVSYLETWNAKYALHYPWRFIGGWAIDAALRAARLNPRPEPMLRVVRHLALLERSAPAAALLAPWTSRQDLEPPLRDAVALWTARARLAAGSPVRARELEALEPPPELAGDRRLLLGWSLMAVDGDVGRGFEELVQSIQQPPGPTLGLRDFTDALCDRRVDARQLAGLLSRALPPPQAGQDGYPVVQALLLARASARARAGDPAFADDLARLSRADPSVRMPTRARARFQLADATGRARLDPQHPWSHVLALLIWAEVNIDVGSTEPEAAAARDLIVERLRRLGATAAVEQLTAFDAVDEVYVRRAWVSPEVHPWRVEAGR